MTSAASIAVWVIAAIAVFGILVRPWRTPEWAWALAGAAVLVAARLISPGRALGAVRDGADVYAFLIGILAMAELARTERLFDWIALRALRIARGSQARLLALVYAAGTIVTVFLSNDTTVVVLTPAVLAALRRIDAKPLPYLYACAFVANAASFVLPISNPANLVFFNAHVPTLIPWLAAFGVASIASVGLTYAALAFATRTQMRAPFQAQLEPVQLRPGARTALVVLTAGAVALVVSAAVGGGLGLTALGAAAISVGVVAIRRPASAVSVARHVSWSILPLVAGLFIIVAALDASGAIDAARALLRAVNDLAAPAAALAVGLGVTLAANVFNNLPVALAMGTALAGAHVTRGLVDATLVAVDLGPNLSITGSLATLLWLVVLRRAKISVTPWHFFRMGALVLAPALIAALLLVR